MDANSLHIVFDKVDGFIKVYDETRYLVSQKHGFTYSKNQY